MPTAYQDAADFLTGDDNLAKINEFKLKDSKIEAVGHPDGSSEILLRIGGAGSDPKPLSDLGIKTLASVLGIPANYIAKCPAALQQANLDHGLTRVSDNTRRGVVHDGTHFHAVTSPRFYPTQNTDLLEAVQNGLKCDDPIVDCTLHDWTLSVLALRNPAGRTGVLFTNSLTNQFKIDVQGYIAFDDFIVVMPLLKQEEDFFRFKAEAGADDPVAWAEEKTTEVRAQFGDITKTTEHAKAATLDPKKKAKALESVLNTVPGPLRQPFIEAFDDSQADDSVQKVSLALAQATLTSDLRSDQVLWGLRHAGHIMAERDCTTCHRQLAE